MSRKILLTTTAIALAAGLASAQAQTSSQDRTSGSHMQNSPSQGTASSDTTKSSSQQLNSTQEQNDRTNSQADRAQNKHSPQASPSGSSAQRSGSHSKSNTAQSKEPRGSRAGDNVTDTSRSSASDNSRSGTAEKSRSSASDNSRSQQNSRARSASPSSERSSSNSARTSESSNRASAGQSSGRNAGNAAASVKLSDQQRTRIAASISAQKIEPVTNVNFSISVGTRVPRSVHLHTVSADIVSTVPQYRGYSYFVTNNQIVIVEPRTYEIVSVLPYSGGHTAAKSSTKQKSSKFSSAQRETIKKRIVARPARTTVTQTREITVGDEVPETIILEDMPETVYTEVPGARPYRYYRTDRDVVIVDPADRHIVDVLD